MKRILLLLSLACAVLTMSAQTLERVSPESVGMDAQRLANADAAIEQAIQKKNIPGAVLAVVRHGKMAYIKAYGNKRVDPKNEPMTIETVFDMASCSKAMSTAVCAMTLIEQGKIRLQDRVSDYIPGYEGWTDEKGNKTAIRIIDLMTHTSGLPAYADANMLKEKYGAPNRDGLIDYIAHCKRIFNFGIDIMYSCLNFITLQRIIETVSGDDLRTYAHKHVFDVLGMKNTDYNPSKEMAKRCAPTEKQANGKCLLGYVHDPLAGIMNGGISGNAGVFTTADDVAILCAALQNGGEWNGHRILGPATVKAMRTVPRARAEFGRALGWDVFSPYANNVGDLLSPEAYGHTGFTGTSIVIDPVNDISIILLTNSVHPNNEGSCIALRSYVANAVAGAIIK